MVGCCIIQTFVSHISTEYRKVFIDNLNEKSSIKFGEILEKEENIMEIKDNPFVKIYTVVKDNIHEILNELKIYILSEKNENQQKIKEDLKQLNKKNKPIS